MSQEKIDGGVGGEGRGGERRAGAWLKAFRGAGRRLQWSSANPEVPKIQTGREAPRQPS